MEKILLLKEEGKLGFFFIKLIAGTKANCFTPQNLFRYQIPGIQDTVDLIS